MGLPSLQTPVVRMSAVCPYTSTGAHLGSGFVLLEHDASASTTIHGLTHASFAVLVNLAILFLI